MVQAVGLRKVCRRRGGPGHRRRGGCGRGFGFLGPNGQGSLDDADDRGGLAAERGTLRVLGMDPAVDGSAIRARLGVCPQENTLDSELTVRENLTVYGRYFGMSRAAVGARADELLDFVQLTEKSAAKVDQRSGGMRRRLDRSGAGQLPDLLLLDEPTTGSTRRPGTCSGTSSSGSSTRASPWSRPRTMDEAEQLCDRLVVMDGGVIVAEGSPRELIATHLDP